MLRKQYSFRESDEFLQWARESVYNDPNLKIIPIDPAIEQHLTTFSHKQGILFVVAGQPLTAESGEGAVIQRFTGVEELGVNGDSAPNRRWNYRFTATKSGS